MPAVGRGALYGRSGWRAAERREKRTMNAPEIQNYRFGQIVIDGQTYDRDLIILPGRVLVGWWRQEGHVLNVADLKAVFDAAPDLLVVGQGAQKRMIVPGETRRALEKAGIELIAEPTDKACQTYNARRVQCVTAAALHLTC